MRSPSAVTQKCFTSHTGIVMPMDRDNVDTDTIIPKQFMKSISRQGFGQHLFDSLRYLDEGQPGMDCTTRALNTAFTLNQPQYQGASILLSRENFGCGSSREHAPWALTGYGFRVIIAESFGDIFYNNAFKNGLLPLRLDSITIDALFTSLYANSGFTLTVDLTKQVVTTPTGDIFNFAIEAFHRDCLLKGLDNIALTLQHSRTIHAFEARRRQAAPWIFEPLY